MKAYLLNKKWLAFVCIIIASSLFYIKFHPKPPAIIEERILVEAAPVKEGTIPVEAHAIGTLTAAKTVPITSEIAGHVAKILFKDGSFVTAGTPLIQLDDAIYRARLESAKAHLQFSQSNYNRTVLLGKQGAIAKQAIEQARADLEEKKALAKETQVTVDKMLLIAPFDGMIGQVKVNPGNYVQVGQELVTVADTHHLRVEYSVPEKYLPQLKLGQSVKLISNTYPGKEFTGTVEFISPTIDTDNRTISLYANVDNNQGLLTAGLFVNVTQLLGTHQHGLIVPSVSLMPTIDGQQVYKIVNNKAFAAPVTLGQRTSNTVEILGGLQANDMVVIAGQEKLKEGSLVKIKT